MRSSRLARLAALSLVVLALGCSRLVPLTPTSAVLLPQAQQEEVVRAAIARSLTARRFVAESEEPGRILARYQNRGVVLRVQIDYTSSQYQITYLDSVGMGHQVDETGQTVISAHYPRYVRSLSQTIDSELGRPEREAAEAVERDRQHQIALAREQTAREQAQLAAEQRERDAERNAQLEGERLRTERARAEAEARRPVIVAPGQGAAVGELAFDRRARVRAGFGVLRARGRRVGAREDGYAGGPNDAGSMSFPNYCRGWFAQAPSHVLQVDRARPVRIEVSSQIDTTLAIVTSDGNVWCDDDGAGGLNPRIEGQFPAGSYYVWVGSYNADQQAPYEISLVEYSSAPQAQAQVEVQPQRRGPARTPACTQAMLQRGYSGSDLAYCDGVEARCAVAMIQRGYSGADVANCRGVEPTCAEAMIQRGYSGSDVRHCRGVDPSCATAAIQRGYSGADVANCR